MTTGGYVTGRIRVPSGHRSPVRVTYDIILAVGSLTFNRGLNSLFTDDSAALKIYDSKDAHEVAKLLAQSPNSVVVVDDHSRPVLHDLGQLSRQDAHDVALRTIVLFPTTDSDRLTAAIRAGVRGAVLREGPISDLMTAVHSVATGRRFVSTELVTSLLDGLTQIEPPLAEPLPDLRVPLTRRETEVLTLLTAGHGNAEIADRLSITTATVKYHVSNLLRKLGATDRSHAIALAYRMGFATMH